jgi:hypothetical protein
MSDVNQATASKPKREAVAQHDLIDAAGNIVETMEEAHGIKYTDLASKLSTTFVPTNPDALRMLAVFGAKTFATNTASQVRQKDGDSKDEIEMIDERFEYMNGAPVGQPQWRDDTREGPRWDIPTLASAAVNVLIADGKLQSDDASKGKAYAKFFEQMSTDGEAGDAAVKRVRGTAGVEAEYRKLKGKTVGTTDSLAAMLA